MRRFPIRTDWFEKHRRTGRTTRMLQHAIQQAAEGRYVFVICTHEGLRYRVPRYHNDTILSPPCEHGFVAVWQGVPQTVQQALEALREVP